MKVWAILTLPVLGYDYRQHGTDWGGVCASGEIQSPVMLPVSAVDPKIHQEALQRVLGDLRGERDETLKLLGDAQKGDQIKSKLTKTMLSQAESDLKIIAQNKINGMVELGADSSSGNSPEKKVVHVDITRVEGSELVKGLRAKLEDDSFHDIPMSMLNKIDRKLLDETVKVIDSKDISIVKDAKAALVDEQQHDIRPATLMDAGVTQKYFHNHTFPLQNDDGAWQFFSPQKIRLRNEPNAMVIRATQGPEDSGFGLGYLYTFPLEVNVAHQIHFKAPAEHLIGSAENRNALELQVYFINTSNKQTTVWRAVSLFFQPSGSGLPLEHSPSESFLQALIQRKNLEQISDSEHSVELPRPLPLSDLFLLMQMTGVKYHRYLGSHTAPDCQENVEWIVAQEALPVTAETLDAFLSTMHRLRVEGAVVGNYRKEVDLAGRKVVQSELNWVRVYFPDPAVMTSWHRWALATQQIAIALVIIAVVIVSVAVAMSFTRQMRSPVPAAKVDAESDSEETTKLIHA